MLQMALEMYADDHDGKYPANTNELVPNYMIKIPTDPRAGASYPYNVSKPKTEYELNATLDNPNDPGDNNDGGNNAAVYEVGTDPGLDLI